MKWIMVEFPPLLLLKHKVHKIGINNNVTNKFQI